MEPYFEFMQRTSQNSVGGEEGFLDAVAVVDVDVYVEDALVFLEKLQDGQHAVVDVAEPRGFLPFGVMETSAPVDGDVDRAFVDQVGAQDRACSAALLPFV